MQRELRSAHAIKQRKNTVSTVYDTENKEQRVVYIILFKT